jgi:hypothetical protein
MITRQTYTRKIYLPHPDNFAIWAEDTLARSRRREKLLARTGDSLTLLAEEDALMGNRLYFGEMFGMDMTIDDDDNEKDGGLEQHDEDDESEVAGSAGRGDCDGQGGGY